MPAHVCSFFWRRTVYGCPDDVARFLFFSRAALEFLAWANKVPDALHIHDWQV
jgi:starch synthase